MGQYLPVLVMLLLGAGFAGASLVMSRAVSPKRPSAAKSAPYECGIIPRDEPPERFPVRFYLVAMIFIVLDVEIIFLFPYAVLHEELGVFGLVEMLVFAIAVVASLMYMIANGALDWGPVATVRRQLASDPGSPLRTARTPVRRVGTEGREPLSDREAAA
jgi:NADH-quinone oxidoreductase subunit A